MAKLPPIPWETSIPTHRKLTMKRAGIIIDLRRCIGCHSCSVSCKTEHDIALGDFRNRVRYLEHKDKNTLSFLPQMCMHCQDAPCMNACESQAIIKLENSSVVIDQDKCMGDQTCVSVCPYDAIYIDRQTQLADKCDLCTHRTSLGQEPACVNSCPTGALLFGDLDDPQDPVTQFSVSHNAVPFKASEGTKPNVLYVGLEAWMEDANTGIQISPLDDEIIYEQQHKTGANADGKQ